MKPHRPPVSARERWILARARGGAILDVGFAGQKTTSPPYFNRLRAMRGESLVIGLDYNESTVVARKEAGSLVGDARRLPFSDVSIDCLILGEFLEHQTSIQDFLTECYRVLRRGGRLLITTPSPYFLNRLLKHWLFVPAARVGGRENVRRAMGHPDHLVFWDPLSVSAILQDTGFAVDEITSLGTWLPGLGQTIPRLRSGMYVNIWPFNRLGYVTCIRCSKPSEAHAEVRTHG
jgi:SAM-dependent methyltransferase